MNENEPVTETSDTAAAPGGKPTVPADLAWSLNTQESEAPERHWRGHLLSAGLIALLCATVAVVRWFSATLYREQSSPPAAHPTPSVSAAPAPPTTATVTVTPAPAPSTPALSATDRAFLAEVQHYGLYYSDPAYPIAHAHALCNWITAHPNTGAMNYVQASTIWTDDDSARNLIIAVVPHYCPQFNSGIGR
jgi:Protein of unknown function (DUF732)